MPNPLSRMRPNANLVISADVLNDRPQLAALMLACISAWAHLESYLIGAVVDWIGEDAEEAVYALVNARSSKAQKELILERCRKVLAADQLEILEAIIEASDATAKSRNRLAHWVPAICPELPDHILLCDPKASWRIG
ncbi:hypothetical protein [Flaviflagellibacter deserti]|uniref:Uncharacterized protein n=1 Tax=Flaviflagellibacter deserti TaxID=2267266 RepID=A0ABV9YVI0_9HYPH